MLESIGMTVARNIPLEVIGGLLTNQYTLNGGVIRWAAGTENAGQIIRHLIPVRQLPVNFIAEGIGAYNTYQLHKISGQISSLSGLTQQVLNIAKGTMILSGLDLAVSAVGFLYLSNKINKLESKIKEIKESLSKMENNLTQHLKQIGRRVEDIHKIFDRKECAELLASLDVLNRMTDFKHQNRTAMSSHALFTLSRLFHEYTELFINEDVPEIALVYEEYFCITAIAHSRCYAELGELSTAKKELSKAYSLWKPKSQKIAQSLLSRTKTERLLIDKPFSSVPMETLVGWLDFAYDQNKGFSWVNELRDGLSAYFNILSSKVSALNRTNFESIFCPRKKSIVEDILESANNNLIVPLAKFKAIEPHILVRELPNHKWVTDSLQKLVYRNNVIEGYLNQYELLEKHNMTPSELNNLISKIPQSDIIDGFVILEPKQND